MLLAGVDAEIIACDLDREPLPLETGSFGVVICNETIEHLQSPGLALRESRRVLRADGVLLLTTPNRRSLVRAYGRLRRRRHEPQVELAKLERLGHSGHVREYGRRELEALLAAADLRTVEYATAAYRPAQGPLGLLIDAAERLFPGAQPFHRVVAAPA